MIGCVSREPHKFRRQYANRFSRQPSIVACQLFQTTRSVIASLIFYPRLSPSLPITSLLRLFFKSPPIYPSPLSPFTILSKTHDKPQYNDLVP
ncbi:unnamed protein product [Acanthoscelides obtectus]|uniref:Uncharacterized protein n=1 Tax=Acanthoscelides obtectus TaxID=200917 RepID=A0A9P0L4C6_ACAOB|nr:unnamed protein product [Acanthoscelides obtectus]CAK1653780.1 hypothetical protein AOBTE_LOCUS18362 [Acanthoscelides obtectus]